MNQRVSDLHNEMLDLKKCQVDLMKIAIALFAVISSIIVALYGHFGPIEFVNKSGVAYEFTLPALALLSIIPLIYPYIAWIIIHKCRSLFRISSYIRFLEEQGIIPNTPSNVDLKAYGYERLYAEMGKDAWLNTRFTESVVKNFFANLKPYSMWGKKYKEACDINITPSYIGGYYSRILRFIIYMSVPYWATGIIFSIICIVTAINTFGFDLIFLQTLPFIAYIFLMVFFATYNTILLDRYNKELKGIPFSKCAQYEILINAFNRIKAEML